MNQFDSELMFGAKIPPWWLRFSQACSQVFLNRYFFLFLFCLSSIIVITEQEVFGALIFVGIISVALVLCEDVLATTLPFLLLCVFVTRCYNSYDTFIRYVWIAIPAVLAILFHMIVYCRKIRIGSTFWGFIAVSIALLVGGIGTISAADYFRPITLYYTLGLGIGMIAVYLLLKSRLSVKRDYSVSEKFLSILYITGMFAFLVVFFFISENFNAIRTDRVIPDWQPSNNISTILMFALPCPFFFVSCNRLHILSPILMFTGIVLTGSRAGILLGALELLLCLIVFACWDKQRRFLYVCLCIVLIGLAYMNGETLLRFTAHINWGDLISEDESRFKLLFRAFDGFRDNPIFGHGLGYTGNTDIYNPVKGAMEWYHMMIPQVIGSMGLIGIIAYLFQLVLQTRAVLLPMKTADYDQKGRILTLAMSYVGVLLMSQLNPGLFCPLPYTLLGVMIFTLLDGEDGPWPFPKKKKSKEG